ncbi:unnamed protein product [Rotaria socialis]|uniref:Uncharacterized protein n=1 Tax=Rotaria socialis TaxID=392032 RepID=A0A818EXV0_9BILA|nr:unnamed protein product [Rotaria socialis]CAF3322477.1 unnamed protein product [Rotaria socialis]CAF3467000.1 unnamed protein product [Rotaria socialis]CAF3490841.1 unnamed protein product [Rotaria socialis]CAF3518335.1 unnamed protein product [Rotaria socialis]
MIHSSVVQVLVENGTFHRFILRFDQVNAVHHCDSRCHENLVRFYLVQIMSDNALSHLEKCRKIRQRYFAEDEDHIDIAQTCILIGDAYKMLDQSKIQNECFSSTYSIIIETEQAIGILMKRVNT